MKKMNRKLWLVTLLLMVTALLFTACQPTQDPAETTAGTDIQSSEVTTTPDLQETDPPAETDAETQAPQPEKLTAEQAMEVLANAIAATKEKTAYHTVMEMQASAMGMDMGKSTSTEIFDGKNYIFIEEAEGMLTQAVILDDKAYFSDIYEEEDFKSLSVVPLTAEQRAWVVSLYVSDEEGGSMDFSPDNFVGVSGVKEIDGSVTITAEGLDEALMSELMGGMDDESMQMTLTVKACTLTISSEGLLSRMNLDMDMSGSIQEEGISMDITANMKASISATYDNITVSAPSGENQFEEESFESYFMITPDSESAAMAGLPLDQDSYIIGAEGSEYSADDQYMMLSFYSSAYAGKTFTIYGTVSEDEMLGVPVINAGEYGVFYYYCPDGVTTPLYGDSVKITATFENTVDKGYDNDYYCYTMMVSACDILAHGVGPNGGRLMFITASSLNVRTSSDTSTSDNIIGTLSKGDVVEVFDQDEKGWWRIEFNGQTAYISNKYVSETKP